MTPTISYVFKLCFSDQQSILQRSLFYNDIKWREAANLSIWEAETIMDIEMMIQLSK